MDYLFIAEKPSLAEAIAQARGEQLKIKPTKKDGYWEVGKDAVSWLYGHMFTNAPPSFYKPEWGKWSMDSLPMVLNHNEWKLIIPQSENKYSTSKDKRPSLDKKAHVKKVNSLIKEAKNIVNCGDAAREGQLLVDELIQEAKVDPFGKNVYRLWVRSMARKDMIDALDSMEPNLNKRNLYNSAVCRSRADWLHGMNYTTLFTLLAQQSGFKAKINVGRVMTPTLKLVVDRDNERDRFKPTDYYIPKIKFNHSNGNFFATWIVPEDYDGLDSEGRLIDKNVAKNICDKIKNQNGDVTLFKSDIKYTQAPLPYSLSALQADCGSKFGLTAQQTLDVAQVLYEKYKFTTYPRTDSRYLPTTILKDQAKDIISSFNGFDVLSKIAKNANTTLKSSAWDDSKVSDHHGIIPTLEFDENKFENMLPIEKKVFILIAKTFLAQFYNPFKYKSLSAQILCEKEDFRANGQQTLDEGWRVVFDKNDNENDSGEQEESEDNQTLPEMNKGDKVKALDTELQSKRTSPPPAFTDGTLITAMANIHKFVTNPEQKKKLKETDGIGTEATRAATIEKLLHSSVGMLTRKGKNGLLSTEFGKSVIELLPEEIKEPGLTALWEGLLGQVENGDLEGNKFIDILIKSINKRVEESKGSLVVVKGIKTVKPLDGHGNDCPKCKIGKLITKVSKKGDSFLSCNRYPNCDYIHSNRVVQTDVDPLVGHNKECDKCHKGKMITKQFKTKDGRTVKALSCSNYPACKNTEWENSSQNEEVNKNAQKCDVCKKGVIVLKTVNKDGPNKGKKFKSCTNEECNYFEWENAPKIKPIEGDGKQCPECKTGILKTREITKKTGEKEKILSCSNYPSCKHVVWQNKK
jgi:DNA topoisomerase-3